MSSRRLWRRCRGSATHGATSPPSGRGHSINSLTFRAGSHKWKLPYYTNGAAAPPASPFSLKPLPGGHHQHRQVSVDLRLRDNGGPGGEVTAAFQVSILGRDGKPAYRYSYSMPPRCYSGDRDRYLRSTHPLCCSVDVVVTPEELAAALRLMGDASLVVRCDVTVLKYHTRSPASSGILESYC
ncbi:hypothetical protein ACP4OV_001942 [Aristida adscensionis]